MSKKEKKIHIQIMWQASRFLIFEISKSQKIYFFRLQAIPLPPCHFHSLRHLRPLSLHQRRSKFPTKPFLSNLPRFLFEIPQPPPELQRVHPISLQPCTE